MQSHIIMKTERYPYLNNPYGFKLPERNPVVHDVIKKWDDFSESDKEIFLNIKKKITGVVGDCRIFAFGSRINGNWVESSDYDVIVKKDLSQTQFNEIRSIEHDVKVDVMPISANHDSPVFSIEII
jgi:predicted nucleotidyltransferase